MTQAKKLKKAIRARSRRTGESYTAARRQLLRTKTPPSPSRVPAAKPIRESRGQVNETTALRRTGHGLGHWFAVLDAFGAAAKGHTAAARHLRLDHGLPSWYCQGITVAYERARGLRAMNQTCKGTFEVSVSRAVPVSVAEAADAIGDAGRRRHWLRGADAGLVRALNAAFAGAEPRRVQVKDATSARLRYPWDGTAVEISILGKAGGRATVVATHTKLRDGAEVEKRRAQWKPALDALKAHLMS